MSSAATEGLEVDYLVVGAGAMGMAFTDELVAGSDATVMLVDRHSAPGGHWNDAYPFVRLHSASATYGVNSANLGHDEIESAGLSRGYYEQASAAEICAYFDRVLRTKLLPSGRVRHFPQCSYEGHSDGVARFVSLVSGQHQRVKVRKRIVDATFTDTVVPSKRSPGFSVAPGMRVVSPNALTSLDETTERFVVIGAGKTGIDVCLWLLQQGVASSRITWIMPRDSWLLDREHVQPKEKFFMQRMGSLALQSELILKAESIEHLFQLLNKYGALLRIDENVVPTRFRCATVSFAELAQLRRIENIVREGHVLAIETDRILMDRDSIQTDSRALHIDCTASGIRSRATTPVFADGIITLQPIRTCQQCFSSALIAHLELTIEGDNEKNRLATPIPLPIRDVDWLTMYRANLTNQFLWSTAPDVRQWISQTRLDPNGGRTTPYSDEESAVIQRFKSAAPPAIAKITQLLEASNSSRHPRNDLADAKDRFLQTEETKRTVERISD